jgi:hypothetical protein
MSPDHSRVEAAVDALSLIYSRIEAALRCEARGVKLYSVVLRAPRTKQMGPDRFARRVKTPYKKYDGKKAGRFYE